MERGFYAVNNFAEQERIGKLYGSEQGYVREMIITKNDVHSFEDLQRFGDGQLGRYSIPYRPLLVYSRMHVAN